MFPAPVQSQIQACLLYCSVLVLCLVLSANQSWAQNRSPVDPGAVMQQDFLRYTQPDAYNPSPMRQGNRFKPGKLEPVIINREDIKVKAKLLVTPPATTDKMLPFKPADVPTSPAPNASSSTPLTNPTPMSPLTQERFLPWQPEHLQPNTNR